jgi:hypothetical protein
LRWWPSRPATVSVGAFAAAPTASAMPLDCQRLSIKAKAYGDTASRRPVSIQAFGLVVLTLF